MKRICSFTSILHKYFSLKCKNRVNLVQGTDSFFHVFFFVFFFSKPNLNATAGENNFVGWKKTKWKILRHFNVNLLLAIFNFTNLMHIQCRPSGILLDWSTYRQIYCKCRQTCFVSVRFDSKRSVFIRNFNWLYWRYNWINCRHVK